MATLTIARPSGAQEFTIAFPGAWPGSPCSGLGELVVRTDGQGGATVTVRLFPTPLEFQARIFGLIAGTPLEASRFSLAREGIQPGVRPCFEWEGTLPAGRLPADLPDLAAWERWVDRAVPLMPWSELRFTAVTFHRSAT